jgi:uncharacterized OB-fold protein
VACLAGDTNHVDSFRLTLANFSQFARDAVYPYGAGGPNASFAFLTAHYMQRYGAKREDFGKLCVAQRANALRYAARFIQEGIRPWRSISARGPSRSRCISSTASCPAQAPTPFSFSPRKRQKDSSCRTRACSVRSNGTTPSAPTRCSSARAGRSIAMSSTPGGLPAGDVDFVQAYDDYPVITLMQLEDLGFCGKGRRSCLRARTPLHLGWRLPAQHERRQLSAGQAGAAGGFLGMVEAIRQLTGEATERQVPSAKIGLVSGFGMINYDRGLGSGAAILAAGQVKKKNPILRTRLPTLPPAARSRVALGLTAAAALGRFELQQCGDCGTVQYPPREACQNCLSTKIFWKPQPGEAELLASTVLHHSNDLFFRERLPWRLGLARLACGPTVVAHLHAGVQNAPARIRVTARLDRAGQAVLVGLPDKENVNMAEDRQLREFSLRPEASQGARHRRQEQPRPGAGQGARRGGARPHLGRPRRAVEALSGIRRTAEASPGDAGAARRHRFEERARARGRGSAPRSTSS